ncbi:MAG: DUF1566 domain-containing protein [Candidatus Thiodiazotropha sp. (ex Epidulcina cf. delphinae)]|nr:DUF1566 domain-containing protein [Candidatus Thiodiazotropha sp. (ex Epidulcina cf. delphinae)]
MGSMQLRSEPATLSNGDVRDMLKKCAFYSKSYPWSSDYANEEGDFKNDFRENGDATVTDLATGLMWQKGNAPDYARQDEAQPYIDRLNREHFAGYGDWRLPTLEELASLMTREPLNDGLFVSPVFSNRMWFWSCDRGGEGTGRDWAGAGFAWAINFDYGCVFCLEVNNAQDIRAVRTTAFPLQQAFYSDVDAGGKIEAKANAVKLRSEPVDFTNRSLEEVGEVIRANRFYCKGYDWNQDFCNDAGGFQNDFLDNFDGTVTDRATGLMWQRGHRQAYGRWSDAKEHICALNRERWCGYSDWRLPTIEELSSIITQPKSDGGLCIDPVFSNRMWVWSCDVKDAKAGLVWNANFLYGSVYWIDPENGQDVRAVRTAVIPPGRAFLRDHLARLASGDIDDLLGEHYREDAELATIDGVVRGKKAIARFLSAGLAPETGRIQGVSLERFAGSKDIILYTAGVMTEKAGSIRLEGAFYLKNGKILRHVASTPSKCQS